MMGYYRQLIPNFANTSEPLVQTLCNFPFKTTARQQQAFETLKQKLKEAPILVYPGYNKCSSYIVRNAFATFPDNNKEILIVPGSGNPSPNLEFSPGPRNGLLVCNISSKLPLNGLGSSPEAISFANTGIKPRSSCLLFDHLNNASISNSKLSLPAHKMASYSQSDVTPSLGLSKITFDSNFNAVNYQQGSVVVLVNPDNRASPSGEVYNRQEPPPKLRS
ncbi:hypothetical protein DSO57_1014536 [Entomophthora muscae]|uniref:Uncharacterized protein n=1 Tax=Entomophthora muscae TaxID=34485 RepID=A0ACC2U4R9_9FUNG|nr:hypothetical protein DSO57_1014536 [Entomophthora muscae]